jgi:hypothetical protein
LFVYTSSFHNKAEVQAAFVHEFGHSFGGLADEYDYKVTVEPVPDSKQTPNCDHSPTCGKWGSITPSCIVSCGYSNWYRAYDNTIMNHDRKIVCTNWPKNCGIEDTDPLVLGDPEHAFGAVSEAELEKDIYTFWSSQLDGWLQGGYSSAGGKAYLLDLNYESGTVTASKPVVIDSNAPNIISGDYPYYIRFRSASGTEIGRAGFGFPTTVLYGVPSAFYDENGNLSFMPPEATVLRRDSAEQTVVVPYVEGASLMDVIDDSNNVITSFELGVLFEDNFDYNVGSRVEQVAPDRWLPRYPAGTNATVTADHKAKFAKWSGLRTVADFNSSASDFIVFKARIETVGSLSVTAQPGGYFGVRVIYANNGIVQVQSNNLNYVPQRIDANILLGGYRGPIDVEIKIKGKKSIVVIRDLNGQIYAVGPTSNPRLTDAAPYKLAFVGNGDIPGTTANAIYDNIVVKREAIPPDTCSDGTPYGQCSAILRPQFCSNGNLVSNCQQCGCGAFSTCDSSGNCVHPAVPAAPTNLQFSFYSNWRTGQFTWDSVAGATGYKGYWGYVSGKYLDNVDFGSSTSMTGEMPFGTYFVAVAAYNVLGQGAFSNELKVDVNGIVPAPQDLNYWIEADHKTVHLSWKPVPSVLGYKGYWGPESHTFPDTYPNSMDLGNVTSVFGTLEKGTYYVVVTAYDNYSESVYSNETHFTVR